MCYGTELTCNAVLAWCSKARINRVYIGEVTHKGQHFPGEHATIITVDVWEATSALFANNCIRRASDRNLQHHNLLRGLLHDGLGRRMQGSQTNRGAKRYHYYITNPADAVTTPGQSWRVPAGELEATVTQRLRAFLSNTALLDDAATQAQLSDDKLAGFILKARALATAIDDDPAAALTCLRRADVRDDRVDLTLCLASLLPAGTTPPIPSPYRLSVPMVRIKRGKDVRLVIGDNLGSNPAHIDPALLKLVAQARGAWQAMLAAGETPLASVAQSQGYSAEHFTLLLRLSTLAPCIVAAIVEGRQPVTLTRQRLAKVSNLPIDWSGQRAVLGFR